MKTILILCTGNSCRSQMAEGFLIAFNSNLEVYSAGTFPSTQIHPKAVQVMSEEGIDISGCGNGAVFSNYLEEFTLSGRK